MNYRLATIYAAIQGEGALAGTPMVIVRLQGCAVGCPWCDTRETWDPAGGEDAAMAAICTRARLASPRGSWVLLTGGEPAAQPLAPLVAALHDAGFRVALETSGTARGHLDAGCDWVCCSPKLDMPGGLPVLPEAVAPADELKFVIGRRRDLETIDAFLARCAPRPGAILSLQPVWGSASALTLAVETAQARDWRLSLQTHKYVGVP